MKHIFPNEMVNTSGGELSLEVIASRLSFFVEQSHLLHWQTFGGFEHSAMNELYDLLFDLEDEIIEKIMGYEEKRIKSFKIDSLRDMTPGYPTILVNEILVFAKQLQDYGNSNNMPDIENIAQSLSGSIAQIKYKLTLS